jgi:lipopolysaccharide transport system permease protein
MGPNPHEGAGGMRKRKSKKKATNPIASAPDVAEQLTVIKPELGWRLINLREMWEYRDLLLLLVWREVKSRYAQTILGVGWAIIQPFVSMVVFSIVFGRLAEVPSDGVPYPIFNFAAMVPWTYFSNSLSGASTSLAGASRMISKVYFPRLIIPLVPVLGKLIDFGIALIILFAMMIYYGLTPTWNALFIPVLLLQAMLTAGGVGMWLTSLAIQYRDVNYVVGFGITLLMYAAPVVYPVSLIPEQYRLLYALNPMAGVIEGFRSSLLGTVAMPWDMIAIGSGTSILILLTGMFYFRRTERLFADLV